MTSQPLDCSDTDRIFASDEQARLTRYTLKRRARRRAQVAKAQQIIQEAAEEMAARRRAVSGEGWREQRPEDRTQVAKVPNRRVRQPSRFDWPTLALFLLTVGILVWGMAKPERLEQGRAVAQGVR
jgi:flagellar biosynthesis/type III secretory pathway M-ring protein FliF/YscJ